MGCDSQWERALQQWLTPDLAGTWIYLSSLPPYYSPEQHPLNSALVSPDKTRGSDWYTQWNKYCLILLILGVFPPCEIIISLVWDALPATRMESLLLGGLNTKLEKCVTGMTGENSWSCLGTRGWVRAQYFPSFLEKKKSKTLNCFKIITKDQLGLDQVRCKGLVPSQHRFSQPGNEG